MIYFRRLLRSLGMAIDKPTKLYVDNQGAVELSKDAKSCDRSRHVLRRYFFVREQVAAGEIEVVKVDTKLNHSDILTKGTFKAEDFHRHAEGLMGRPGTADEGPTAAMPRGTAGHAA